MAISTYSELKAAITDWMARNDVSGSAADFITLAEARLNRIIDAQTADSTLAGVAGSRRIDVSALSVVEPIALFAIVAGDEVEITPKADGTFEYVSEAGLPSFYAMDGDSRYIDFDRLLDQAYSFRFRYRAKLALSNTVTTNNFLIDNPDIYLAASIVWGNVYIKDTQAVIGWKTLLDEFVAEHNHTASKAKQSVLTVDGALLSAINGTYTGVDV